MTSLELVDQDGVKLWRLEYNGMTRYFRESEEEYVINLLIELKKIYSSDA
tara:strand:- start:1135 stop:1284 length:150 start_codon:yes stop_codon:yes gene_type:complete